MSRPGSPRLAAALVLAAGVVTWLAPSRAAAQQAPSDLTPAPAPGPAAGPPVAGPASAPGRATTVPAVAGPPALPTEIQVVRFQGPEGVRVEVLGPTPEAVPTGDGRGLGTYGLKVGVAYRLRVSNLPHRPQAEIFPVVEVVGHLHRPAPIDPGKYPIRVVFGEDDFVDVADRGRLVTQVVYLEDPDQALPITLPKDQIPVVALSPSEDPLRVASALGRVVAIVRMGGRRPSPEELNLEALGLEGPTGGPCPFTAADGGKCAVPCGPVRGNPPPPGRPWAPRDEYLCDGGDRDEPGRFGGDGGLRGIDPRDAVVRFNTGDRDRLLPTNVVCVYAPRFAEVRVSVGPNETQVVQSLSRSRTLEKEATEAARQGARRLVRNQAAEAARVRARASGLGSRVRAGSHAEVLVLSGFDESVHVAGNVKVQGPERFRARQLPAGVRERLKADGIKLAESAVVTGIVEGPGRMVMTWGSREAVAVEVPPNKPGLAVIKRVSAGEAEAGDTLTFVIQYRNMGNTPIRAVSVIDSLLPRLGYVPRSAKGPEGTVFTADENRVGSTELRWDLPGAIAPGAEGYVSFEAVVR